MTPEAIGHAAALITAAKRRGQKSVLIHLVRTPGSAEPWPTDRIPVGRSVWVTVCRYDRSITLEELETDLLRAERQLRVGAVEQGIAA